jgi:ATP-binding protein involved in chromosome partitioning
MSHYICPSCKDAHPIFGSSDKFTKACKDLDLPVLGQIPLEPKTSELADAGRPIVSDTRTQSAGKETFLQVANDLWKKLGH